MLFKVNYVSISINILKCYEKKIAALFLRGEGGCLFYMFL